MKLKKPIDSAAKSITFGVEFETVIPSSSGVSTGSYHHGLPVRNGLNLTTGLTIDAPLFNRSIWKAERDGSIRCDAGFIPCEFVSPILKGEDGLSNLIQMTSFIRDIGGKVNDSCGLHITVGIQSIIGTLDPHAVAEFCRKLAHVAQANAWAIYAQTGAGRHVNSYSSVLREEVEVIMRNMVRTTDPINLSTMANRCGRGMVNFNKVFSQGVIEFRAFAGTLNLNKIMHHLATVLGICRRAATVQTFGKFNRKESKKHAIANSTDAVRRMWRLLGWVDSVPNRDVALGLFGVLHCNFGLYRKTALEMAEQFESRFPVANL